MNYLCLFLVALKSRIQGVPDDLRESLRRLMSLSSHSAPEVLVAPPPSVLAEARKEPEERKEDRKDEGEGDRMEEREGPVQEKEEEGQEGEEKKAESEELDHPYDMLTRVQIDFEPYVLLLQVRNELY